MKIVDVICCEGVASYFHMDQKAILAGAKVDGFAYVGKPQTPNFRRIVEPADALGVLLILEDGQIAFGDCIDVVFAGTAGRDPPFVAAQHFDIVRCQLAHSLRGHDLSSGFRVIADNVEALAAEDQKLHTAVRYGVSQALLHAVALDQRRTIAEVVAVEYGTELVDEPVAIGVACEHGDFRQLDRMILKRADVLPHVSFTKMEEQIGRDGEIFATYVEAVIGRIRGLGDHDYNPRLRFDLYGRLSEAFDHDLNQAGTFLLRLSERVGDIDLLIETPVLGTTQEEHVEQFCQLRSVLRREGRPVHIVADEWCNTLDDVKIFVEADATDLIHVKMPDLGGVNRAIEAALLCKAANVGVCLGGTVNETDQSARISAQIALACGPDFVQAKPGHGGDEGLMVMRNEMARTLALIAHRRRAT